MQLKWRLAANLASVGLPRKLVDYLSGVRVGMVRGKRKLVIGVYFYLDPPSGRVGNEYVFHGARSNYVGLGKKMDRNPICLAHLTVRVKC